MVTSVSIIGGGDQEKRQNSDFYPTPPEVTHALMLFLKSKNVMPRCVWECACGEGDMMNVIGQYTHCIGTDINDAYHRDFLRISISTAPLVDAIITNPPFVEADKFIRKAVQEVPLVAMLLKSTYWHAESRKKLFFKHRPAYVLPLLWRPNFLPDQTGSPVMDVLWTVWIEQSTQTVYEPLSRPSIKIDQLALF